MPKADEIEAAISAYRAAYLAGNGKSAPKIEYSAGYMRLGEPHHAKMRLREMIAATGRLNNRAAEQELAGHMAEPNI